MAQPDSDGYDDGGGRFAALRIGGLAVIVVLAVVVARARAAGMTPNAPAVPSIAQNVIRIIALTVMVGGGILLIGGRRRRKTRLVGKGGKRKKPLGKPSRRVVIAALVGLLFAFAMQILGNTAQQQKRPPPPQESAQQQGDEAQSGKKGPAQGEPGSGIANEVIIAAAVLTLGVLVVVLVRRRTEVLEEEPDEDEDEDEAMAEAMRAARAAVLDKAITDPRSAIVACFAAMEGALADRGDAVAPLDSDTPSEVLYRGIDRASLPEEPAYTLLRLFREARFSTHPITEQDRGDADDSLGELLRALESPAGELSGGTR